MDKLTYRVGAFEGPLDLLLTLISAHKLKIFDIPISDLLDQYLEQIHAMRELDLDIASEFLEMAARLLHIKTLSLLPKHEEADELRRELTGELLEYQVCKRVAGELGERYTGFAQFVRPPMDLPRRRYEVPHETSALLEAYFAAAGRGERRLPVSDAPLRPLVSKPVVSVGSRIVHLLRLLWKGEKISLRALLRGSSSRSELVATFLAVLELLGAHRITVKGDGAKATVTLEKDG